MCHQVCSSVGSRQQFSSSMPQNSATPHPPFSGHSASPPRQRGVRSPPAPFPPQPSSLSLSDRRLWRAWENHPGWLHTPSEPLNHLRNQDRTFASTSWSTTHLSSQSPARDLRPPPHRPSSRTQLGWEVGLVTFPSCWMQCLVAFPSASCRAIQVCFVLLVDAVALFCSPSPVAPARRVPSVCKHGDTSMAER